MTPRPPYRACHSVIRLRSHAPNFVESDAHAVPASPHTAALRIASVAFATRAHATLSAGAWLKRRWTCSNSSYLTSGVEPETGLSPAFVPKPSRQSKRRRAKAAFDRVTREQGVSKASHNPLQE